MKSYENNDLNLLNNNKYYKLFYNLLFINILVTGVNYMDRNMILLKLK